MPRGCLPSCHALCSPSPLTCFFRISQRSILHPNGNLAESERFLRAAAATVLWTLEPSAGADDVLMNDVIPALAKQHATFYRPLRACRAFGQLDEEDVSALAFAATASTAAEGEIMYAKAESESKAVAVLRSGEALCLDRDAAGNDVEVATLTPGEWFIEDPSANEHTATIKCKVGTGQPPDAASRTTL